ncbi:MAG: hypothetical protein R6U20_11600 [Longimonas sp.]|uniref:hypothetical protein n=1 Tax=Longimonas sp. TaxID=2039626 RepID=UPI003975ECFD
MRHSLPYLHAVLLGITTATLLLVVGCGESGPSESVTEHTIEDVARFAGEPDSLIGNISSVAVAEDGDLFVRDGTTIHAFRPDGTHRTSFGREGEGPGEMQFPVAMNVRNDSVFVVDLAKQQQVAFTTDGAYAGQVPIPVRGSQYAFGAGGHIAAVAASAPDSTVAVYDQAGNELYQAVTPLQEGRVRVNMQELRSQIASGEVPDELHAMSTAAALDANGGLWFVRPSKAAVMRYTPSGAQKWAQPLDLPEADRIRDAFFEANAALERSNSIVSLQYLRSPVSVDDALWLMVGVPEDEPAQIIVIDDTGTLRHRIRIPDAAGARSFALSPSRERIYLSITNQVQILTAPVPEALR